MYSFLLLGFGAGVLTGMLSIGGGIIITFILGYIMPLFGIELYTMHEIGTMVMIITIISCLSGGYPYIRQKLYDPLISRNLITSGIISAFLGSFISNNINNSILKIGFGFIVFVALILMFIPNKSSEENEAPRSFFWTILSGLIIGLVGGMYGIGAGFIYVPFMMHYFKLSIKKSIGTSLICGFSITAAAFLGRLLQDETIYLIDSLFISLGSIFGARVGAWITKQLSNRIVKTVGTVVMVIIVTETWYHILSGYLR